MEKTSIKSFQILKKIGDGSFSQVFLAKRIKDQTLYAIKKIKLNLLSNKEQQNALNEIRFLASIKNSNIISYKETFIDQDQHNLYLVLEYAEQGDVYGKIKNHKKNNTYFDENELWRCLIQNLAGLSCLHDQKICHRDIKSGNIFICQNENKLLYKLGDFNVSKISKNDIMHTQAGTPYYCAPEIWKNQVYSCKTDIWSLGAVIYEMAALQPPFLAQSMDKLKRKVCEGKFNRIPDVYSDELWKIVQECLKVSQQNRPSALQLLNTPIMRQKINELEKDDLRFQQIQLIETIQMPKNISQLQLKLPKANYETPRESYSFKDQDLQQIQKTYSLHDLKQINNRERLIMKQLTPDILEKKIENNYNKQKNSLNIFNIQKIVDIKKNRYIEQLLNNDQTGIILI